MLFLLFLPLKRSNHFTITISLTHYISKIFLFTRKQNSYTFRCAWIPKRIKIKSTSSLFTFLSALFIQLWFMREIGHQVVKLKELSGRRELSVEECDLWSSAFKFEQNKFEWTKFEEIFYIQLTLHWVTITAKAKYIRLV